MCYLVYDIILYHFDTTIFCVRASIALAASANGADGPTRAQKKPSPLREGGVGLSAILICILPCGPVDPAIPAFHPL